MSLVIKDRISETTTTSGTSDLVLGGATPGYQSFAVIGDTNTVYYCITDGNSWEVGLGTYSTTGPTLARTTVYSNSLGTTAKISLTVGVKNVFAVYPAEGAVTVNIPTATIQVPSGGVLPVANGGTGSNTATFSGANITSINANNVSSGVLAVAQGGTGSATATFSGANITSLNASSISSGTIGNAYTTASSANGANTIVSRDANGDFSARIITATTFSGALSGSAAAATSLNGSNVSSGVVGTGYGGTGLTGFTAANNAIYSTSSSALTAGTLPVTAGGTGQTTYTNGQLLIGNTTGNTLTKATLTGTSNQVVITNGGGSITLATPQDINTASNVQFGSFGVGTAASGTTGEIRATNNVTAYYSSDRRFKENIRPIQNALASVDAIGGVMFDWTDEYIKEHGGEDGYFVQKEDFGVIAQDVQKVFPQAVRERQDGSLAVDYSKLVALAFAAIKELKERIEKLEA